MAMGFLSILAMASMPVLKVLLMGSVGRVLASSSISILGSDARKHLNKILFIVFTPALVFTNLAQVVTPATVIAWWYLPVNVIITFVAGAGLGLVVVKLFKPAPKLERLTIACCSAGNIGNLPLLLIPAVCMEPNSPFGEAQGCIGHGVAYASFGLCVATLLLWTVIYYMLKPSSADVSGALITKNSAEINKEIKEYHSNEEELSLMGTISDVHGGTGDTSTLPPKPSTSVSSLETIWSRLGQFINQISWHDVLNPPNVAVAAALFVGVIPPLKNALIGQKAPLRFIQDSLSTLGNATLPSLILLLGASLSQGVGLSSMKASVIAGIVGARLLVMPILGICIVLGASHLSLIPSDPFLQFVLLLQYTMPTAMTIGTISQLFDMGPESSVILFWSYMASVVTITSWTMTYIWLLFERAPNSSHFRRG